MDSGGEGDQKPRGKEKGGVQFLMPGNNKNYADNMYDWLKRKGHADKYEHAGIYCIKLDGNIVYIGKSHNMLKRVAQHYAGIKLGTAEKYCIIRDAQL